MPARKSSAAWSAIWSTARRRMRNSPGSRARSRLRRESRHPTRPTIPVKGDTTRAVLGILGVLASLLGILLFYLGCLIGTSSPHYEIIDPLHPKQYLPETKIKNQEQRQKRQVVKPPFRPVMVPVRFRFPFQFRRRRRQFQTIGRRGRLFRRRRRVRRLVSGKCDLMRFALASSPPWQTPASPAKPPFASVEKTIKFLLPVRLSARQASRCYARPYTGRKLTGRKNIFYADSPQAAGY